LEKLILIPPPKEIAKQSFADDNYIMKSGRPLIDKREKIIHLNKTEQWVSVTKVPRYNKEGKIMGTIGITRDITERKKAEEVLRKSQQEFVSLFKSSPEALVYLDEKGNILNINPPFTELFGYNLNEVKGRNLDNGMIHPPNKIEEGKKLTEKGLKGDLYYETIRKKKDGTLFPVYISGSRVMLDGKLQGVMAIVLDTTNFYIALIDEKENKIFFPYNIDNTKSIHLPRSVNHNSLVAEVIRTGKPIFANREIIKEGKSMMEFKEWFGILRKVWLGSPLRAEDRVIGAMVVQSYANPNLYHKEDIKLMEYVSNQIAIAIERKRTEERIRYLSFHDALTGLYNRAYFEEELKRYNFSRYYPLSVIMIDINGLKIVNDSFGHDQGDKLLQHFASLLGSISRKGDVVARLGGDEFVILLPSTTAKQVHDFHKRIKKICEEDNIKPIYLRPSIALGCVTQKGEYQNTETLLKEADKRMYQDKDITK
jgi:diguanylate cyclase (GGDEF)-like protein/PAS domain S-box-containing protein